MRTTRFVLVAVLAGVGAPSAMPAQNLPEGAIRSYGLALWRVPHAGINSAISPDGKTLAVAGDFELTLLDLETGKILQRIRDANVLTSPYNGPSVSFSADSKSVAAVAKESTIRIFDANNGKLLRTLGKPIAPPNEANFNDPDLLKNYFFAEGLRFVNDGKELAVHALYRKQQAHLSNGQVRFLDPASGKTLREIRCGGALIGFGPDHKALYSINLNASGRIDCFDSTGKALEPLEFDGQLRVANVSADNRFLVLGNYQLTFFVWDLKTGERIGKFDLDYPKEQGFSFGNLDVTPDGKVMLLGLGDGLIHRRELATGKALPALRGHRNTVTDIFFRNNGTELVSVCADGVVTRWDLQTGKPKVEDDAYGAAPVVALSADGRILAIGDSLGRLDIRNVADGKLLHRLRESGPSVDSVAFQPGGSLIASAGADNKVVLWDAQSGKEVSSIELLAKGGKAAIKIPLLLFTPDGKGLLTATEHDRARLWDVKTGNEIWRQNVLLSAAAFSPDGKTLVTASRTSRALSFRDAATGRQQTITNVPNDDGVGDTRSIAYAPDGSVLITTHSGGAIRVRHPNNGAERWSWPGAEMRDIYVNFSRDSKWLATSGADGKLRIWEALTGREVLVRELGSAGTQAAIFLKDGKSIMSGTVTGATLWDMRPVKIGSLSDPETTWNELAGDDAGLAFQTQWAMVSDPKATMAILSARTSQAGPSIAPETLAKWIVALDSDDFDVREDASEKLAEQGKNAEPALREVARKPRSAEQLRRAEVLLARFKREPSREDRAASRATQVLELISSGEAKKLLEQWGDGKMGPLFQQQAKAALERMR